MSLRRREGWTYSGLRDWWVCAAASSWRSYLKRNVLCVCNPWSHRDAFAFIYFLFYRRGAMNTLEGIAQRRPFHRVVIFLRDASGTYLLFPFPFEWREAKPRTSRIGFVQSFDSFSADVHEPPSPRPVRRLVAFNYRNSGPLHLVFQDLGLLGWRVAPHSVPYTISQVCLASCQPGMSPQSASRGPVERVYVDRIHCPDTEQLGLGRTSDDFVPSLEFQVGSCLYVTAAVKAASRFGRAQGDHSGQSKFRFIGTCGELSPLLPCPPPFFPCFLGFS